MPDRVVVLPEEEWDALRDHPATLRPDDPGEFWVMKVKSAVRKLSAARALDDPALVERVAQALAEQDGSPRFEEYTPYRRAFFLKNARAALSALAEFDDGS